LLIDTEEKAMKQAEHKFSGNFKLLNDKGLVKQNRPNRNFGICLKVAINRYIKQNFPLSLKDVQQNFKPLDSDLKKKLYKEITRMKQNPVAEKLSVVDAYNLKIKSRNEVKQVEELITEVVKVEITLSDRLNSIREYLKSSDRKIGEQTEIKEGFVYLVENEVYPGWIKVGMTIDYESRIGTYNIYDPFNKFKFVSLSFVKDRRSKEQELIEIFKIHSLSIKGEWFKIEKQKVVDLFIKHSTD
jgi:hypothetical protein